MRKTLFFVNEILCNRGHMQCADIVVIRKISSIEDDLLARDVHTTNSCMDAIDRYEVLGTPVKMVPILMQYCSSFQRLSFHSCGCDISIGCCK
jgi:hypothetical protein